MRLKKASRFCYLFFKKILMNLLGCHWLMKLHRFQVYNSIILHLYVYCIVCSPPLVKSPSNAIYSPFTLLYLHHLPFPLCLCLGVGFPLLNPFNFYIQPQPPSPLPAVSLGLYSLWSLLYQVKLLLNTHTFVCFSLVDLA